MENKTKAQNETSKKPVEMKANKKLKFALAFIAGSALAGCGDTINNYYYDSPDGGQKADTTLKADSGVKPDTLKPDTLVPDTLKPDACVLDKSCTVGEEKAVFELTFPPSVNANSTSTLKEGESQTISGITVKVKSINETVSDGSPCTVTDKKAVLEVSDANGTTQVTLKEGENATISGATVKMLGINVGMNGLNCSESGSLAGGILNQGGSLPIGKYKLVFEDGQQVGDKVYALLNVLDSCGTSVDHLKVEEGKTAPLILDSQMLTVSAYQVGVGSTFAAKWTKLSVSKPCEAMQSTCKVNVEPIVCSDYNVYASGQLDQGEWMGIPANIEPYKYRLQMDDGQTLNGKNYVAVSFYDSCGNLLLKKKFEEGSTNRLTLNGDILEVTVDFAMLGYTFGAKWAEFTVKAPCTSTFWCPSLMGVLNQGESLSVDSFKVQLDDLQPQGTTSYALLSVLDANGNTVAKLKVAEGGYVEQTFGGKNYRISVPQVAPGYTFGAKWAKIEIQSPFSKPCGSP